MVQIKQKTFLKPEEVEELKRKFVGGNTIKVLALEFNVSQSTVRRYVEGLQYKGRSNEPETNPVVFSSDLVVNEHTEEAADEVREVIPERSDHEEHENDVSLQEEATECEMPHEDPVSVVLRAAEEVMTYIGTNYSDVDINVSVCRESGEIIVTAEMGGISAKVERRKKS